MTKSVIFFLLLSSIGCKARDFNAEGGGEVQRAGEAEPRATLPFLAVGESNGYLKHRFFIHRPGHSASRHADGKPILDSYNLAVIYDAKLNKDQTPPAYVGFNIGEICKENLQYFPQIPMRGDKYDPTVERSVIHTAPLDLRDSTAAGTKIFGVTWQNGFSGNVYLNTRSFSEKNCPGATVIKLEVLAQTCADDSDKCRRIMVRDSIDIKIKDLLNIKVTDESWKELVIAGNEIL